MSIGPRNRLSYERSQAVRWEICELLTRHPRLAPPLTAKAIRPQLSRVLSERAIRWHIQAIRQGLRCRPGNSSSGQAEAF
jgi:hypothetical protein